MKTAFFAAALALIAAGPPAPASAAADAPQRTTVTFVHPEKFTDVKDRYYPTDAGRDGILRQIKDYIVQLGDRLLPPGYHLAMTFTNIDLAGEFEPWHGAQWDDVRIVKPIYPPRFKFSYSVTDPAGKVLKQGSENDTDMDFDLQPTLDNQDPLRYEKAFLGTWIRGHLAHLKG
ncbi:MAG TPA: DUF3016 domain-containing protein [Opitutaceae bacterium]|nr:DUF3016 domain-containing protein [Opitutaceae bacterium]